MTRTRRLRATAGIAVAQLRHDSGRTALAALGVALAVLATTLLASVGFGVIATGQEAFDASGRDLWVTGGPVRFDPGSVGGFENGLLDAHEVARDVESRESVDNAAPLSFQTVYVGTNRSTFRTLVATGVTGGGPDISVTEGSGFTRGDVHYAGGDYDGPMTRAVLIDPRTAALFDVEVGDSLYVGGTIATARRQRFTVVGISPTFSRFLGAPTVTMHLSELQAVTGASGTDRATLVTASLEPGRDPERVEAALQATYPEYDVRTNREQLRAVLREQSLVIASGVSLVGLSVVVGLALTVNLLLSFVSQQRRALCALKALGCSSRTLVGVAVAEALVLGVCGGLLGVIATPPAVAGLNYVAASLAGFEHLVRTPPIVLVGGFAGAVVMSAASAAAAGWRVGRLSPLAHLSTPR